ncbi:MAG: uroporphyrinogen decarboxylase family protein [Phycisphaerae bacterium]
MAYKGVLDDIRKCAKLQKPNRIPVFGCSEEFDVRVCGNGMTYESYCTNAKDMASVQIAAVARFGYDWSWMQVDDCIMFELLGVGVKGEGNILRATYAYLPATFETLKKLKVPDPEKDGRMPVLLESIATVKAKFGDTLCVCGRTEAPFSSAGLLYGLENAMMLIYEEPNLLRETMEFFVEAQTRFGLAQYNAGADALWFGDCNASSHLLSPKFYEDFAFEPAKRCTKTYTDAGGLVFYHASEEGTSHQIMTWLGVSALTSGPGRDTESGLAVMKDKICYLGNLDPIHVLQNGTKEKVAAETVRIMELGKKQNGFMFNTGEMVPRETPVENMIAMVQTAKKHGELKG